jgi:hypothetical protein
MAGSVLADELYSQPKEWIAEILVNHRYDFWKVPRYSWTIFELPHRLPGPHFPVELG